MEKQRFSIYVKTEVWPQLFSRLYQAFNRKQMNVVKVESETNNNESSHRFDFLSNVDESSLKVIARQVYRTVGILNVELYINNEQLNFKKL